MKYISHVGGLWRLSDKNYNKLCKFMREKFAGDKAFNINLDNFGTMIGTVEEFGGVRDEAEQDAADKEKVT